jgi:hypothetical protein
MNVRGDERRCQQISASIPAVHLEVHIWPTSSYGVPVQHDIQAHFVQIIEVFAVFRFVRRRRT